MKFFKYKILIIIFLSLWLLLFIQIKVNNSFQEELLYYCQNYFFISPLLLILSQILFSVFFLPCSVITILAGILWGWKVGILYSTIATLSGSYFTFLLGKKYLNSIPIPTNLNNYKIKVNKIILEYGWKSSFIVHINPLIPGSSIGYFFGASKINLLSFLLGVLLGTLPLQLLMVLFGSQII